MSQDDNDTKLLLADDHPLLLKGLAEYLQEHGFHHVALAKDGRDAKQKILDFQPDAAILDIDMPYMTGIELAKWCQSQQLSTKIILLTYLKDPAFILEAKENNISGYVIKDDAMTELIRCIRVVLKGDRYFSLKLKAIDINDFSDMRTLLKSLTRSEMKILKLIDQGLSSRDISERLDVATRTVEKHRSNIIFKLGIQGQSNALNQWLLEHKSLIR